VVSFTVRPLFPRRKGPRNPFDKRLCGTQWGSGRGGEERIPPCPCRKSNPGRPPHSLVTIRSYPDSYTVRLEINILWCYFQTTKNTRGIKTKRCRLRCHSVQGVSKQMCVCVCVYVYVRSSPLHRAAVVHLLTYINQSLLQEAHD
jgi:hypothetical protein